MRQIRPQPGRPRGYCRCRRRTVAGLTLGHAAVPPRIRARPAPTCPPVGDGLPGMGVKAHRRRIIQPRHPGKSTLRAGDAACRRVVGARRHTGLPRAATRPGRDTAQYTAAAARRPATSSRAHTSRPSGNPCPRNERCLLCANSSPAAVRTPPGCAGVTTPRTPRDSFPSSAVARPPRPRLGGVATTAVCAAAGSWSGRPGKSSATSTSPTSPSTTVPGRRGGRAGYVAPREGATIMGDDQDRRTIPCGRPGTGGDSLRGRLGRIARTGGGRHAVDLGQPA